MYRREKEIIVTLISMTLIMVLYSLYVYNKYIAVNPEVVNDFKFWGKAFLILIPVTIVTIIIIYIIFFIINKIVTNEDLPQVTDERDRMIELKGIRISHWVFVFGFMLAMASQAFGMKPWVLFVVLFGSGFVSTLAEGIAKICYYRKGY